jgi:hypothetical protein
MNSEAVIGPANYEIVGIEHIEVPSSLLDPPRFANSWKPEVAAASR